MGFGSLEAALTTTAVALQIALAGGLGRAGAGAGIINGGLSGAALQKNKAAEMSVRGVLTAMSVKIPITKLLKMAIPSSDFCYYWIWLLLCGKLLNTLLIS
jgi:hypothetical protein